MRTLSILAAGLLLVSIPALPVQSAPAVSPQGVERATDLSAQSTSKRKKAKKAKSSRRGYDSRASARGQQIACTQLGCHPIPRGCRVVPGRIPFTWDPSGFDDIVCPYRR